MNSASIDNIGRRLAAGCALALSYITCAQAAAPEIPLAPGVTFVLAVGNSTPPDRRDRTQNTAQGDYEVVVTVTGVNREGVAHTAFIDAIDANGTRRQGSFPRQVLAADLADSHQQVLGRLRGP